jgi:hypothetical protein
MRTTYVFRQDSEGRYVPIPIDRAAPRDSVAPAVIDDSMPMTWHPADDRHYDSKSAFRRVTRSFGYEEKGNDGRYQKPKENHEKPILEAINKTFAQYGLD